MHFESSSKPKATLKIGPTTYNFRAPTVEESEKYSDSYESNKENPKELKKLMHEYMSLLGNVPVDQLKKIESDLFYDLFSYIVSPVKKN